MYCANCGERLIPSATSCPSCGSEVRQSPAAVEAEAFVATAAEAFPGVNADQAAVRQPFGSSTPGGMSASTKKSIGVVLAAVVILFLIFKFTGNGGGSQATPEKTFKSFMSAVKKEDAKKMISYMEVASVDFPDGENMESLVDRLEESFGNGELDLRDYRITRVETTDDQATIDYEVDYMEKGDIQTDEDTLELQKTGGKWYISGGLGF